MDKSILAFLVAGSLSATSQAAEPTDNSFAVEGPGQLDCASFNSARVNRASPEYQRIIGFLEGYLTAANRYEDNTFDLTPWHNAAALDLILNSHCIENQEDSLISVVQRMVTGLRPIRLAKFSPMVEVGDDRHKTIVYKSILGRAQAALRSRGLYAGEETEMFSSEMRDALIAFQRQNSLNETGVPDPATLWTLLNP